jgi:NitT/TauT family transport system substrate-binding protein
MEMRQLHGVVACLLVLAAPSVDAQTKIAVGYGPAGGWMPAFVAKDQGFFTNHGLDVTLNLIAVGSNQPAALIADAIQIAGLNPAIVIFADEGGADIQVVANASTQTKTKTSGGLMARTGLEIGSASDLVGRKVAVPGLNSVYHLAFMKWLQLKGVDPNKVTYVEIAINQMGDAIRNGQVDAALPTEPFASQIAQNGTGYMVKAFTADLADPVTAYSVWAMRRAYIEAHPEVAPAFRAALTEAIEWIAKNETEARKTQITYLKLPEQVAMTVPLSDMRVAIPPEQMQWWIDVCKELGVTKGTATLAYVLAN